MRRSGWIRCLLLASVTLLTSCGLVGSSDVIFVAMPRLILYEEEVMSKAADEMEKVGPPCSRDIVIENCSAMKRLVIDYGWLREQVREGAK